MKPYIMAILLVFISSQAMACMESAEKKEQRFRQYDANKDGYVDAEEWDKMKKNGGFTNDLADYIAGSPTPLDKDNDKKLSKEEFLEIGFVKCL